MKWTDILKNNFRTWEPLADFLQLNENQKSLILKKSNFILNLPLRLAQKIEKSTLDDPILKQFLPILEEEKPYPNFSPSPTQENRFLLSQQLLQKYSGRALLISTQACAMHCRYCFRRHFDYKQGDFSFKKEIEILKENPTLSEVILSGGDPLSLQNKYLKKLIRSLSEISHLKLIRWHTRFPIGIPERIDSEFLNILEESPLQQVFVIHCNHFKELDTENVEALKKIQKLGIPVLNQAVLLKGVNNSIPTLKRLCLTLASNGILSYYLHYLDKVEGAGHFQVSKKEAQDLIEALRCELPGYALPNLVEEQAGASSKTNISFQQNT